MKAPTPQDVPVLLAYTDGLIEQIVKTITLKIIAHDPKLSPLRAGEIAAAVTLSQAGKEFDTIYDFDLLAGASEFQVRIIDRVGDETIPTLPETLIDLTRTRTLRDDVTRLDCGFMNTEPGLNPITKEQALVWLAEAIQKARADTATA